MAQVVRPFPVMAPAAVFAQSDAPMQPPPQTSVSAVQALIDLEVGRRRLIKVRMQFHIREALESSQLQDCSLEVVGSVSWDGDVPQSDLDMMLLTPQRDSDSGRAVALLQQLFHSLQDQVQRKHVQWDRLELLTTAKVPILRARLNPEDCYCDIAVDQLRSLHHRDYLLQSLTGRPQVRSMLRLVKFWLRQRGLPLGAEAGLPSLAWVFAALSLADEMPATATVEVLLTHFFSEMHKLGTQFLDIRLDRSRGALPGLRAFRQEGWVSTWKDEWTELFRVADPGTDSLSITPPSMPTALGLLYVAELRVAWNAILAQQWPSVWRAVSKAAKMELPQVFLPRGEPAHACSLLHVILKEGVVFAGRVQQFFPCPGLPATEVLHRRDQSSQLHLQEVINGGSYGQMLTFQPCHWICTLSPQELKILQGDSLLRVAEIAQMVGLSRLNQGLQQLAPALAPNIFRCAPMPSYCVWMPANMTTESQCGNAADAGPAASAANCSTKSYGPPSERQKPQKIRNLSLVTERTDPKQRSVDFLSEAGSEESTRASETEDIQPGKGIGNDSCGSVAEKPSSSSAEAKAPFGAIDSAENWPSLPASSSQDCPKPIHQWGPTKGRRSLVQKFNGSRPIVPKPEVAGKVISKIQALAQPEPPPPEAPLDLAAQPSYSEAAITESMDDCCSSSMPETESLLHITEPTSQEIVMDTMPLADEKNCPKACASEEAGDLCPHPSSGTSSTALDTMVVAPDASLSASLDSGAAELANNEKESALLQEIQELCEETVETVQLIADKPKVIAALPLVKAKLPTPCKGYNQKKPRAKGQGVNGAKRRNSGDSKKTIDIAIAPQHGVPQLLKWGAVSLGMGAVVVLVAVAVAFHQ